MALNKISLVALALATLTITGCMDSRSGGGASRSFTTTGSDQYASISQSDLPPPEGANQDGEIIGINLAAANIAGVWNANIDGMNCKIATPMTKFGAGFRTAPMHCPAAISSANSWNISGAKLEFYDASGAAVATLTSQDGSRFNGQTTSGAFISLSR